MSEMNALQILQSARDKLADPSYWGKGARGRNRPLNTCCVAEAIEEASNNYSGRVRAFRIFRNAAGIEPRWGDIVGWNDAPERTHNDVMKTLNLAIAILRG